MMSAPEKIVQLIEIFERNKVAYKSPSYKETDARVELINPFFKALGWDTDNEQGLAEAYKDVIHEDAIKVGGATKAPDYCFRIGGTRKFFVEAKKPSVNIKDDPLPAYQLRRYGWNQKLPMSILTNFEELAIYDCRIKPNLQDKAGIARIKILTYKDYISKWDFISSIFSKDAILKGSFDKFAESNKGKKGTQEVDDAILQEIEGWRDELARYIALYNPDLSNRNLNDAVQKTIDRILFLRICEDRAIEHYGQLQALLNGTNVYERLFRIFYRADEKYNSGLFHFSEDKERQSPDVISLNLKIEDKPLKEIIKRLYYPESPYEFSIIPVEILGQVYERFLGKVIRLTPGHRAKVEEKPEVRKAGGVYYTPQYIVDYIVSNTLGKVLENKTPEEAKQIKILDPACGSGSFLIGAYNYLLMWFLGKYTQNADNLIKTKNPPIYQIKQNEYKLTIREKKEILLNNLYGVDIDSQAVEVTKLSLMLKALEGETEETLSNQFKMFKERALPDLDNNIKCGNSLIGSDFYDQYDGRLFGEEDYYKINAFDWQKEFLDVFHGKIEKFDKEYFKKHLKKGVEKAKEAVEKAEEAYQYTTAAYEYAKKFNLVKEPELVYHSQGGFDVVIGNPPYLRVQGLQEYYPETIPYLKNNYKSAETGNIDLYVSFIEKGYSLLNTDGYFGFIVPHKFFPAQFGENLREMLTENKAITEIVHFGSNRVFEQADAYTCMLFLTKKWNFSFKLTEFSEVVNLQNEFSTFNDSKIIEQHGIKIGEIKHPEKSRDKWNFKVGLSGDFIEKLLNLPFPKLKDIIEKIFVGLQTSADDIYVLQITDSRYTNYEKFETFRLYSKSLKTEIEIEKGLIKPFLMGRDLYRYQCPIFRNYVLFPYQIINQKAKLMTQDFIKNNYPLGWEYLLKNKKSLENREKGIFKKNWWQYGRTQNLTEFESEKIMIRELGNQPNMNIDRDNFYHTAKIYSLKQKPNSNMNLNYLLGILNSKLLCFFIKNTSEIWGTSFKFKTQFLNPFPIPDPKTLNPKQYDKLVRLVELMLELNKRLHDGDNLSEQERIVLKRKIEASDNQIDRLVYELYDLTEEEIKIAEEE